MKKFDLNIEEPEEDAGGNPGEKPKAPKGFNLALNLDAVQTQKEGDQIAEMKERLYDAYDPSSSRRVAKPGGDAPSGKPKLGLALGGITGQPAATYPDPEAAEETITGSGTMVSKNQHKRNIAQMADNVSMLSSSPMHTGKMSTAFRQRLGAGGIPTPLGSDMSRTKFDFSGYDPALMRKKKAPSPERKVIAKVEDDMEIFTTDHTENPSLVDLEKRNTESSQLGKKQVLNDIYPESLGGDVDKEFDMLTLKKAINEEEIQAALAYKFFNEQEYQAVVREQEALDL